MAEATGEERAAPPNAVRFHYIKSPHFRVIHADGAHGGITPSGYIQMTLYADRVPIPKIAAYAVGGDGRVGGEIEDQRVVRDGFVRELEVTALMDLGTATALRQWLDERIEFLAAARAATEAEKKK